MTWMHGGRGAQNGGYSTPLLDGYSGQEMARKGRNEARLRHHNPLTALQGNWVTGSGQIARVSQKTVVFTFADGTVLPPPREITVSPRGEVSLLGSILVRLTTSRVLWSDNDLWTRKYEVPSVTQHPTTPRPKPGCPLSPAGSTQALKSFHPLPVPQSPVQFPPQPAQPPVTRPLSQRLSGPPRFLTPASPPTSGKTSYSTGKNSLLDNAEPSGGRSTSPPPRRLSVAPPVSEMQSRNQKVRSFLCCCFRASDVGDTYADIGQIQEVEKVGKEAVMKVRAVLPHAKQSMESAMLGKVLVLALGQSGFAARYTLKARWKCLVEAAEGDDLRDGFKMQYKQSKREPKIPQAMHGIVRLMSLWWAVDADNSGWLDLPEVSQMMAKLNFSIKQAHLKKQFEEFDTNGDRQVDFDEFIKFYEKLQHRKELVPLYQTVANGKKKNFVDNFLDFLHDVQNDDTTTKSTTEDIVREWSTDTDPKCLTMYDFSQYLTSPTNKWFTDLPTAKNMTHPITHYFISSSHNTYLSGNQLSSESKAKMYEYVLQRGCKCVEIDCWDGPNGEPIVTHGHTVTSKITFKEVVETINEHAFSVSDYPVVVSLEVHTTPPQQRRMAEIMSEVWGEKLYPLPRGAKLEDVKFTPNGLKGKILVKGPKTSGDIDEDVEQQQRAAQGKKSQIDPALSNTVFFKNTPLRKGGVKEHCGTLGAVGEVTSLVETKVMGIAKGKDGEKLIEMNQGVMTRIYPQGTRVGSNNFNPMPSWVHGSQLVALNFQTGDYPVRLNQAFFKRNGGCGYILKPDSLLQGVQETPLRVAIEVISGGNLPKPNLAERGEIIDPFVSLWIAGAAKDDSFKRQFQTKVITDNGFNPVWREAFAFTVTQPSVAVLSIRVMDHDLLSEHDFIGESSCPVLNIRQGYRSVPLHDAHYRVIPSAFLLCKFTITAAVAKK